MKYDKIEDGKWYGPLKKNGWREMCCDCHLTHDWSIKTKPNGEVWIKVRRNQRATSAARRAFNIEKDEE